jgi:dipeptidyl aminopeptidase/acylaminoacyl peptidase
MRIKKWTFRAVVFVVTLYLFGTIALAEISLHPVRIHRGERLARLTKLAEQSAQSSGAQLQDVSLQTQDGTHLQAWFVQPAASNGNVVVLLHGLGDSRAGMAHYMAMFLQSGYSLLMPDSRGNGASSGLTTYGLHEAGDVHEWVSWIETNKKPNCVFGLGESMGAAILLQSLQVEHRFCAVVAEPSFSDFREAAYDRVSHQFRTGPWLAKSLLRPAIEGAFLEGRAVHQLDLETVSPRNAITGVSTPILLIHGDADTHIRLWHSQLLHQANPRSELWVVPGVKHTMAYRDHPAEFAERVKAFFAAHSTSPAVPAA